jgi:hypothetical protein
MYQILSSPLFDAGALSVSSLKRQPANSSRHRGYRHYCKRAARFTGASAGVSPPRAWQALDTADIVAPAPRLTVPDYANLRPPIATGNVLINKALRQTTAVEVCPAPHKKSGQSQNSAKRIGSDRRRTMPCPVSMQQHASQHLASLTISGLRGSRPSTAGRLTSVRASASVLRIGVRHSTRSCRILSFSFLSLCTSTPRSAADDRARHGCVEGVTSTGTASWRAR